MRWLRLLTLAACATFGIVGAAFCDELSTHFSLDDLPEPPKEVAQLIEMGSVSFRWGERSQHNEPGEIDRISDRRRQLAAETRFQLKYDYSSRMQWRVDRRDGDHELSIRVHYNKIDIDFSHDVWFRSQPSVRSFWQERLVKHELDHVRISTDPQIKKRFGELVRSDGNFVKKIEKETEVDEAMVRKIVDEHVEGVFVQIIDLIRIRYEELDRVTDHGLRPIPAASEPSEWVKSIE